MSDERARELIRNGSLAGRRPNRIWGGPASGAMACLVCGVAIKRGEVALEVEFTRGDGDTGPNPHFHVRCFSALEAELRNLHGAARPSRHEPGTARASSGLSSSDGT
jgi:hypothetical protein